MIKERHSSVTVWLVIWIIWNVLGFIFNLIGSGIGSIFGGNSNNLILFGIIGIVNITCYILIFNWKFIGVIGKIITSVVDLIINIAEFGKFGKDMDYMGSELLGLNSNFSSSFKWLGFLRFIIFMLLFFSVLCKRHNGQPSTWDYLTGNTSDKIKPKKDVSNPNALKCNSCQKVFSSGYVSCPHCGSKNIEINNSIIEENTKEVEPVFTPIVKKVTENTKKCKRCGEKVDEDIFKCPKCRGDTFI